MTAERLWSVSDLADYLGVPVATIYQWRTRHEAPPGIRLGRHLRFDPVEVRAWLRKQSH